MDLKVKHIDCQEPPNQNHINRKYNIVKCTFDNTNNEYRDFIHSRALTLSSTVHPGQANDSINSRNKDRRILDSMGGLLAEYGWLKYIKTHYGNIASFTEFNQANGQIDIRLENGETIEIRSSFPRNGAKFAICHDRYNFKNICTYSNLYKPSEQAKSFFGSVLFETRKDNMLFADKIVFFLIGGSTKEMMLNDQLSYTSNLIAEDDITQQKTKYKVIKLKNALDMEGFDHFMTDLGYEVISAH